MCVHVPEYVIYSFVFYLYIDTSYSMYVFPVYYLIIILELATSIDAWVLKFNCFN